MERLRKREVYCRINHSRIEFPIRNMIKEIQTKEIRRVMKNPNLKFPPDLHSPMLPQNIHRFLQTVPNS
jgi:hypothetical protein